MSRPSDQDGRATRESPMRSSAMSSIGLKIGKRQVRLRGRTGAAGVRVEPEARRRRPNWCPGIAHVTIRPVEGAHRMIPLATYRLQFHEGFRFADAARLAPYLARLGISHVYASPYLKARPGSTHGYDIVDHRSLNPELGDQADFDRMVAAFAENGLGQILDFVPNHIGVGGADNPLWLDVLEWGQESIYAGWFDIDWKPDQAYLRGKLLVPFLGEQYGIELEAGNLALKFDRANSDFA